MTGNPKHQYRSIFISDTHLGSRGCKSELLLDFLEHRDCQNLYMVGDIFDGWRLRKHPYWSLSSYIKENTKSAVEYIAAYEEACANEARERGFDGVICGHIHHAAMREIDGVMYYNDGDWVESCTALVEGYDGQFHFINWAEYKGQVSEKINAHVVVKQL